MAFKNLTRRSFAQKLGILAGALGFSGLINETKANDMAQGNFVHVVFFWLHEPDNEKAKKKFLKSLKSFISGVDVIQSRHVGPPAGTPREVVDNSYTYCLIVSFKNSKDHDIYQAHPLHKKFIQESESLWEKVQVYDTIA